MFIIIIIIVLSAKQRLVGGGPRLAALRRRRQLHQPRRLLRYNKIRPVPDSRPPILPPYCLSLLIHHSRQTSSSLYTSAWNPPACFTSTFYRDSNSPALMTDTSSSIGSPLSSFITPHFLIPGLNFPLSRNPSPRSLFLLLTPQTPWTVYRYFWRYLFSFLFFSHFFSFWFGAADNLMMSAFQRTLNYTVSQKNKKLNSCP